MQQNNKRELSQFYNNQHIINIENINGKNDQNIFTQPELGINQKREFGTDITTNIINIQSQNTQNNKQSVSIIIYSTVFCNKRKYFATKY